MDSSSVQALIDKVRGLSASKFPDTGYSAPAIEVSVTSNEGKRVEKVSIAKSGDHFIAKRENEPSLYELDSSSITEWQKAAAEMKVASTPEPAKPGKK